MTQAPSSSKSSVETVQNWLVKQLAEQLSLEADTISVTESLTRYGLDSIDAVTMVGDLEDWLDLELPSTLFWDYPTIAKTAEYLEQNYDLVSAIDSAEQEETSAPEPETAKSGKGWGGLFGRKK
ncbi:MAG: hypothetical protein D6756_06005 [Cyanobacteria bacterium J083]|nr:MAG: hypothetical protein D6756_06005 [Cyanobacteria bacterium J083]